MELRVNVRRGHVADGIRDTVERKLQRLERRLPEETVIEVMLDRVSGTGDGGDHAIEAEVHLKGPNVFGHATGTTYETAADRLVEVLERQIERRRDKKVREPRRRV